MRLQPVAALLVMFWGVGCTSTALSARVHEYVSEYEQSHLSSGVVLIARGDSVLVRQAFGYADWDGRVPNTPATRFRIGSITKSMTWAAVSQLVDRGLLDWDAPVASLIEARGLPPEVTVRRLATHEAGIADWSTYPDAAAFGARRSTLPQLTAWIASQPLNFPPGTDRQYSNSDYVLLASVVEAAAGRPYGRVLAEDIFEALGMSDTGHAPGPIPGPAASGYAPAHAPSPIVKASGPDPSILIGSGSVVSTVDDLFRWSRSAEARRFPWDRGERRGRPVTYMGGFVTGFGAWVEHYTDQDLTVIVLTNLNNGALQKIVPDLGAIALGDPYDPPPPYVDRTVSASAMAALSGPWTCDGGVAFTIRPSGARLDLLWRGRPPAQPLWAQSDTSLFYPQDWVTLAAGTADGTGALTYRGLNGSVRACHRKPAS